MGALEAPSLLLTLKIPPIANTLIYLGEAKNVMANETMEKLKLYGLRLTPTILQMVDKSTIRSEGVVEGIVVSINT